MFATGPISYIFVYEVRLGEFTLGRIVLTLTSNEKYIEQVRRLCMSVVIKGLCCQHADGMHECIFHIHGLYDKY